MTNWMRSIVSVMCL